MWTLIVASLVAPPPLGDFPTETRPRDASNAPQNTAFFAIGDPAPSPDLVGVTASVNGASRAMEPAARFGCCVLVSHLLQAPEVGDTVVFTLSSVAGDNVVSTTIGATDDERPRITIEPSAVSHGPSDDGTAYEIVIAMEAEDNTQVAMLYAERDGVVVGSSTDGYVLRARLASTPLDANGQLCVDVSVMDVAQNVAPSTRVCVTPEGGTVVHPPAKKPTPASCQHAPTIGSAGLCALWLAGRKRRARPAP